MASTQSCRKCEMNAKSDAQCFLRNAMNANDEKSASDGRAHFIVDVVQNFSRRVV